MNLTQIAKNKIKTKTKKFILKIIKPLLPYILIIVGIFFAICLIIDAVFIQEVQSDISSLSEIEQELRLNCINKADYLNTCHNYIAKEITNNLLDVDNKETGKKIEWAHLYSIMAFNNMINAKELNQDLLNEISQYFESTFNYEKDIIKTEIVTKDEKGKEKTLTKEETQYLLVESNTIIR